MNGFIARIAAVTCLLLASAGRVSAAEPTVAELIEKVPVLTTTDESITGFSFRFSVNMPYKVPVNTLICWEKDKTVGMLTAAGEDYAPVWFLSGSDCAFFDISTGTIAMGDDARPNFRIHYTGEGMELDYGLGRTDDYQLLVDLHSLFNNPDITGGSLTRNEQGQLVLTSQVSERGGQAVATFDGHEPYRLRSFKIAPVSGDGPEMMLSNIRVNDEVALKWPQMPDANQFPQEFRILTMPDAAAGTAIVDGIYLAELMRRTPIAHAALRNPEWRAAPQVQQTNWEAAATHNTQILPTLKLLLPTVDR
ncbi:hypothetical protein [Rubinisphaera margarita]|uniref:hypothetical protein n=1 Tax=Rubinisphaera margarita TaxID=2909586 RepID=UPI001EE7C10B|nr:hypothetical protein [Rubinisphaera margarita]MCG6155539.1 hypothetical protein [Rubinisphaera margarita]